MRLIAATEDPVVARKILAGRDLPARAPPLGSAAGDPRNPASGCTPNEPPAEEDSGFGRTPVDDEP